jgi:hypothetical protein
MHNTTEDEQILKTEAALFHECLQSSSPGSEQQLPSYSPSSASPSSWEKELGAWALQTANFREEHCGNYKKIKTELAAEAAGMCPPFLFMCFPLFFCNPFSYEIICRES